MQWYVYCIYDTHIFDWKSNTDGILEYAVKYFTFILNCDSKMLSEKKFNDKFKYGEIDSNPVILLMSKFKKLWLKKVDTFTVSIWYNDNRWIFCVRWIFLPTYLQKDLSDYITN